MDISRTRQPALSLTPEHTLQMTGTIRLVLVINLGRFADTNSADIFRHVRGSEIFAQALRSLAAHAPFLLDDNTQQIEADAYDLRIFRSRLRYNHFFPTYRIAWDTQARDAIARELGNVEQWVRWTPRLRLTRNGLIIVVLCLGKAQKHVLWNERFSEGLRPNSPFTQFL